MNAEQPLWTWSDLCRSLGLPTQNGPDCSGIHFDSRLIQSGDLFIPLPGDPGPRFNVVTRSDRDGHDFISNAIDNGAIGVITKQDIEAEVPTVRVRDTIDALWTLGKFRRDELKCPVVAITGSSGKTTLKNFLRCATGGFSAQSSFNNYIGLPLSLAQTPRNARVAIYEIGTNHPGEIAPLSELARPTIAVVLNVLAVHIGNFECHAALEQEKFSISKGISPNGCLVLPNSLKESQFVPKHTRTISFGFESDSDITITQVDDRWFEFKHLRQSVRVEVPGGGRHRAESVAACGAILIALKHSLEDLQQIESSLPEGRGNCKFVNDVRIIDDSYNANPTSMTAALRGFRTLSVSGRKIAVLGQMNELGIHTKELHENIAPEIKDLDAVYCVGAYMRYLYEKLDSSTEKHYFDCADDEMLKQLVQSLNKHDSVLVKGSNSVFWQVNFVQNLCQELS